MTDYTPPLSDINFILGQLIGLDRIAALPPFASLDLPTVEAIVEEAGKLASESFAPLNAIGDRLGAKFIGGAVTMPPGFREAYQRFVEGGWNGLPVDAEFGGQSLPWLLALSVQEMLQGANIGLALCTLLNQGAIELISVHGSESLKAMFLPKLVSGEWTGTMNLTEPQAGSDVGAVKTKAVRDGNNYRITGQKIFISYGDHDLATNILHLVLARLPGAPEGTRGLSLFLVPKMLVTTDRTLGAANDLRVVSIEHKLGQHSSPTCVMAFGDHEGAIGYLVGDENAGIAAMFTMMNNARISVGIQGLGLMERATQQASEFASMRIQSRPIENSKAEPVAIAHHPDVARMLMSMKSQTEAARALAYMCGFAVDTAKHSIDEQARKSAAARVDLLTPIVKAWLTDLANEITSTCLQVFGGMGYIEETGVAQHFRDARILSIYEGTNGIQANDLVFRKIAKDDAASLSELTDEIDAFLSAQSASLSEELIHSRSFLSTALAALKSSAIWIVAHSKKDPRLAAASASPFLRMCGIVFGGFYLLRSGEIAQRELPSDNGNSHFLKQKINNAHFFATHILPQCSALAVTIVDGPQATLDGLERVS